MSRRIELLVGAALAALAAAAPARAAEAQRNPSASAESTVFSPPAGPMVLTRELRKDFARGGELVSRRRYAIRFVAENGGWRVDGTLLESAVEAPPDVAPELLELERTRSDGGLFPLHLDSRGLIMAQHGAADPATEQAVLKAAQTVLAGKLGGTDRAAALAMASALQARARAAGGTWPVDLFRPRTGETSEVRTLPVGDGSEGQVTVRIAAADGPDGMLERLERQVVTEVAGTRRSSVETWSLRHVR